ncbi:MAG: protein-L-isoaspartate(D-aspartate) O-methyltransferase [Gammaproteobacteria bacterium]|jgi:protein-L-isoaspartate(D-aspartate) O-methyltransferase
MMQKKTDQARFNMIEQQIKPWNVNDSRVLDAMRHIRREDFVPEAHRDMAFMDIAIPLDTGAMLEPKLVARMLQSLDAGSTDRVLIVGVGTGYVAALLSQCAHSVICVEPNAELVEGAKQKLAMAGISNVQFECGDANDGWPACGEVDRVFVRSSMAVMPSQLCKQLSQSGRCVAVVGGGDTMELFCYHQENGKIVADSVLDTVIPRFGETTSQVESKAEFIF